MRGLSRSSSSAALECLFRCFGIVSSLERKHGFCFVVYSNPPPPPPAAAAAVAAAPCAAAAAAAAIHYLHGATSGCRGEKQLSVHLAKVSPPLPQRLLHSSSSSSSSKCGCRSCRAASPFSEAAAAAAAAAAFLIPRSRAASALSASAATAPAIAAKAAAAASAAAAGQETPLLLRHVSQFLSLLHGQKKILPLMQIVHCCCCCYCCCLWFCGCC